MLGVCTRLGNALNIDPLWIQILFILWGLSSLGTALIVYSLLNFII